MGVQMSCAVLMDIKRYFWMIRLKGAKMQVLGVSNALQCDITVITVIPDCMDALGLLQDARLNYVEQHAERIGLDSGRLESMRVAASKSSPMADTLDLAARYTDIASLDALVPALCQLLKRGVGVNTRVGSARFVASLAARMGSDIRPHTGTLLKVSTTIPSVSLGLFFVGAENLRTKTQFKEPCIDVHEKRATKAFLSDLSLSVAAPFHASPMVRSLTNGKLIKARPQ